jgi:PAS domain S-box-containing protein
MSYPRGLRSAAPVLSRDCLTQPPLPPRRLCYIQQATGCHPQGFPARTARGRELTEDMTRSIDAELLALAVDASNDGIVIAEQEGQDNILIYVNRAFEELTGYTADEILYRDCRFLQGDDTDQEGVRQIRTALERGEPCRVVLRNYRKDGSLFWNELSITPVYNDDDQLTYYIGIQKDITARVEAEARAERAEKALAATRGREKAVRLALTCLQSAPPSRPFAQALARGSVHVRGALPSEGRVQSLPSAPRPGHPGGVLPGTQFHFQHQFVLPFPPPGQVPRAHPQGRRAGARPSRSSPRARSAPGFRDRRLQLQHRPEVPGPPRPQSGPVGCRSSRSQRACRSSSTWATGKMLP